MEVPDLFAWLYKIACRSNGSMVNYEGCNPKETCEVIRVKFEPKCELYI